MSRLERAGVIGGESGEITDDALVDALMSNAASGLIRVSRSGGWVADPACGVPGELVEAMNATPGFAGLARQVLESGEPVYRVVFDDGRVFPVAVLEA